MFVYVHAYVCVHIIIFRQRTVNRSPHLSLVIILCHFDVDEKGGIFQVPSEAVKLKKISHSFLTDL